MKALVKTGRGEGHCEIAEWPQPVPGSNEILIKVEWAGVCGTDLAVYQGTASYQVPLVMGHEFAGNVVAVGQGIETFRLGDRVVGETSIDTCGKCDSCAAGSYNVCPRRRGMGRMADGAFAEYVSLDYRLVHKIPDALSNSEAALCEPAAAAHHAVVERGRAGAGERVFVFGPGPMGILVAQIAAVLGARVSVAGLPQDETRLNLCQEFGCEAITIDPREGLACFMERHSGQADVVFECSGSQPGLQAALAVLKPRGRCVQVGLFKQDVSMFLDKAVAKEVSLLGSYSSVGADFEAVLHLAAAGKIDLAALVGGEFPLAEWREAFRLAQNGTAIKVLIRP